MQNKFKVSQDKNILPFASRYKEKGWAYHEGDPSDQRMLAAAAKRSVCLTSRSRPLRPEDMTTFDYILGESSVFPPMASCLSSLNSFLQQCSKIKCNAELLEQTM